LLSSIATIFFFQFDSPEIAELVETVRLIREHVVARIAALAAAPEPPPLQ